MAKRKKFDEGGSVADRVLDLATGKDTRSVMDKPVKDMRDPQYRAELERKQALETSSPELDVLTGGVGSKGFGVSRNILKRAPTKRPNVRIGEALETRARNEESILEHLNRRGKTPEERTRLIQEHKDAVRKQEEDAIRRKKADEKTAIEIQAVKSVAVPLIRNTYYLGNEAEKSELLQKRKAAAAEKAKKELEEEFAKDYKRGGKVSAASKRADGCAQRGKTKGRMV